MVVLLGAQNGYGAFSCPVSMPLEEDSSFSEEKEAKRL
jgi:hypothetical protein